MLLVVFVAIGVGIRILFIKASFSRVRKSVISVFFKIMANHFQLVLLTLSFEFDWPKQVEALFDIAQPVADVSSRILSLDCFLSLASTGLQNVYVYLLVYLLMPIGVVGISLLFWWIKAHHSRRHALNRAITTIIVLLFLLHPSLTLHIFTIFK